MDTAMGGTASDVQLEGEPTAAAAVGDLAGDVLAGARKRRLSQAPASSRDVAAKTDEATVPDEMATSSMQLRPEPPAHMRICTESEMTDATPMEVHVAAPQPAPPVAAAVAAATFRELELRGLVTAQGIELTPRNPSQAHPFFCKTKDQVVQSTVQMLTSWLDSQMARGVQAPSSLFNGKASVTLAEFIKTLLDLIEHLRCGYEVFLATFIYLRRVDKSGRLPVTWNNVYRLILASVLCAVKYLNDYGLPNGRYARLIGLDARDIGEMESTFCCILQFGLYLYDDEFYEMCTLLC